MKDALIFSNSPARQQLNLLNFKKKSNWLLIVPLKYLVHHYSSLTISAVAIVSPYAFWMRVCLCYLLLIGVTVHAC